MINAHADLLRSSTLQPSCVREHSPDPRIRLDDERAGSSTECDLEVLRHNSDVNRVVRRPGECGRPGARR